jgi:hypothetical protein
MSEYTKTQLAEKFFNIFSFNPTGHGTTKILPNQFTPKGKQKSDSWWVHQPTTNKLWESHLNGDYSIGQVPVNYEGMIQWAAFDVDIYKNQLPFEETLTLIETMAWPFILIRSKSGGAHAYVFFTEPTAAAPVIEKMKDFTAFFGFADVEVFPKQGFIGTGNDAVDFGNWLNMPYDGDNSLKYALKRGEEAYTASEFCDLVEAKKMSPSEFHNLVLPASENEPFEDGPPCLNRIFTEQLDGEGHRDTALFNLAIYHARKDKENMTPVTNWNNKFQQPLPDRVVRTKVRSATSKEYRYQCGNQCLKRFCKASVCKTREFGIDNEDLDPTNQSLIQLRTDPELWYFTHNNVQVCVERKDLWNYEFLRQAFMAAGRIMLPARKQEDWLGLLTSYLTTCTVIDVPPEATGAGQLIDYIQEWSKLATDDLSQICNGRPAFNKNGDLLFRLPDLKELLRLKQFRALPDNKIAEVLQSKLKGIEKRISVAGKTPRCYRIPAGTLEDPVHMQINQPTTTPDPF